MDLFRFGMAAALGLLPAIAAAEVLGTREAEDTTITCHSASQPMRDPWASGGACTPEGWGWTGGDSVAWEMELSEVTEGLKLGIRYAYDARHHHRVEPPEKRGERLLHLEIDGQSVTEVPVPDTGGWNHCLVTSVDLPVLGPGLHTFRLVSPRDYVPANVDAFTVYTGSVDVHAPGALRPMVVATSNGGAVRLCATPSAVLPRPAQQVADSFEALYETISQDLGSTLGLPIHVHYADPDHWYEGTARAIANRHGIYLLADGEGDSRADWCWTLASYFDDGRYPQWFSRSAARVTGLFDWIPSLATSTSEAEDLSGARLLEEAREFLADSGKKTDRAEVVETALRTAYGDDIFQRFWKIAEGARQAGEADFAPGRPLDKHGVLKYLSQAAEADVEPLFRRWTGFASEGPVGPLCPTNVPLRL